jgi:hypothetical protein
LVILVLPNINGTVTKSNKYVFENEVGNVSMTAQNQSVLDSYDGLNTVYASDATQLDINTKSSFKYCVVVGADGEIEKMYVSNGKYYFESNSQISKSDITSNKINVITGEDTITGIDNCMGSRGNGEYNPDHEEIFISPAVAGRISVGDIVRIDDEEFFVIATTQSTTTLLPSSNINTTTNSQSGINARTVAFAEENYWYYEAGSGNYSSNPYPYVYDNSSNLYALINSYVTKLSTDTNIPLSGRAITYEEASALNDPQMIASIGTNYYWTGSAINEREIWGIDNYGEFEHLNFAGTGSNGIRPVVIIDTSYLEDATIIE